MPSLSSELKELFGSDDLYKILDISSTASKAEVKKAYYKLSLTVHPDRVEKDKEGATRKFQALGKVYHVLSDDDKRAVYDETGGVDDEAVADDYTCTWVNYWRQLFPAVNLDALDKIKRQYRGSEGELEDIKSAYLKYDGDMGKILDTIMCSTIEDEPRFRKIISDLIKSDDLPEFEAFANETTKKREARKRKAEKEEKMAARVLKKRQTDNLEALILRNQTSRQEVADGFIRQMELKYAELETTKTKSKKNAESETTKKKSKKK